MIKYFKNFYNFFIKLFTCNYNNKIYVNEITYDKNKFYDITKKIRNFTPLDEQEMFFIKKLPHEQLYDLICLYCILVNYYIDNIDNEEKEIRDLYYN